MAVDIVSAATGLKISSGVPTDVLTICAWVKVPSFQAYKAPLSWGSATDVIVLQEDYGSPNKWVIYSTNSSSINHPITVGWSFLAIASPWVADYGEAHGFGQSYGGIDTLNTGTTNNSAGGTPVGIGIGIRYDNTGDNPFLGPIANVKVWNAELTPAELQQERRLLRPVRSADLWAWWPLVGNTAAARYQDWSGNGRSLSNNGSDPAYVDGPPISWGAAILMIGAAAAAAPTKTPTLPLMGVG